MFNSFQSKFDVLLMQWEDVPDKTTNAFVSIGLKLIELPTKWLM